jgi:hypothetical protein
VTTPTHHPVGGTRMSCSLGQARKACLLDAGQIRGYNGYAALQEPGPERRTWLFPSKPWEYDNCPAYGFGGPQSAQCEFESELELICWMV